MPCSWAVALALSASASTLAIKMEASLEKSVASVSQMGARLLQSGREGSGQH